MEVRELLAELSAMEWAGSPLLARLKGSYRFDLGGEGSIYARLVNGHFQARESQEDADCVIELSKDDLEAVIMGRANLITVFLQGRARMHGDLSLGETLHFFLRSYEQHRRGLATQKSALERPA